MTITFDQVPSVLSEILKTQNELKDLLLKKSELQSDIETPIQIEDVVKLTGLSKPTIYGYAQRNEIPYYKKGNRLKFFKSEIIDWIKQGKQKTVREIEAELDTFLSNNKKGLK